MMNHSEPLLFLFDFYVSPQCTVTFLFYFDFTFRLNFVMTLPLQFYLPFTTFHFMQAKCNIYIFFFFLFDNYDATMYNYIFFGKMRGAAQRDLPTVPDASPLPLLKV